jgi:acyl CoA:acetate/3-ketoacid CoA transferase
MDESYGERGVPRQLSWLMAAGMGSEGTRGCDTKVVADGTDGSLVGLWWDAGTLPST